jgi:ATP-binding cassette subfamily C protein
VPEPLEEAVKACKQHLWTAAGFSALINLLYISPSIYMMQVYDRVVPTSGKLTLLFLTLIVAFAMITQAGLETMRSRLLVRAGLRLDRLLSGDILGRLMAQTRPQNVGQAMREFDTLRTTLGGPAAIALFDFPWTPIYLIVATMIHPLLGALTLVGGLVLFGLAVGNERATKPGLMKANQANAMAYQSQDAAMANAEVVRALGMRDAIVNRQLIDRRQGLSLQAQAQFAGGRWTAASKFTRMFLQSLALGLGAYLAVERQISSGSIIAASILMSRALQPVEMLVSAWASVLQARSALTTLSGLYDKTKSPHQLDRTQLPAPKGEIEVEKVIVRAPGREDYLLKAVSFKLAPGETIGVVGASGAGKTTLARVVAGALAPDAGAVRIDGANMTDWDSDRLARHVGYLPQDSALMAGSIRDNISRFGRYVGEDAEAMDADVVAAAQAAGVHELILKLPKGYDSVLGPMGRGLSAGQAQRVALARALYRDPALLVLDEPNSALDAEGEANLAKALQAAKARGATIMIVAHRTGILAGADRLMVLRDGAIERLGPKDEVLEKLAGREPKPQGNVVRIEGSARP